MSKSLNDFRIADLLPPSLKNSVEAAVLSDTEFERFRYVLDGMEKVYISFDTAESALLDVLAYEWHVDFYDQSLPLETKRELVKNSFKWHMKKGTPAAVEEVLQTVFGNGTVQEWWEYGGGPYHFRIITQNRSTTKESTNYFYTGLNSVKRMSAWLDVVINKLSTASRLTLCACPTTHYSRCRLPTQEAPPLTAISKLYLDTAIQSYTRHSI